MKASAIIFLFIFVFLYIGCSIVFISYLISTRHLASTEKLPVSSQPKDILECLDMNIEARNPHSTLDKAFLGYRLSKWLNGETETLPKCVTNKSVLQAERFTVHDDMKVSDVWHDDLRHVKYGGVYHPDGCVTDEHLAVIIPYRGREKHLTILLNNLHHMLQRQNLSYAMFVVEMALPTQFNKGFLLNMGYLIAKRLGKYNCFVFHDVDSIPINEKNIYRCNTKPTHLSSHLTKYSPKATPYDSFIGGVVMLSDEQLQKTNGFSNAYFGWGGEDDDLEIRIRASNMTVKRVSKAEGKYYSMTHGRDSGNPENPNKFELFKSTKTRMRIDGLNSVKFKLIAVEFLPLYTWVLVGTNETQVMDFLNLF